MSNRRLAKGRVVDGRHAKMLIPKRLCNYMLQVYSRLLGEDDMPYSVLDELHVVFDSTRKLQEAQVCRRLRTLRTRFFLIRADTVQYKAHFKLQRLILSFLWGKG